jgi:hypothetical protein
VLLILVKIGLDLLDEAVLIVSRDAYDRILLNQVPAPDMKI